MMMRKLMINLELARVKRSHARMHRDPGVSASAISLSACHETPQTLWDELLPQMEHMLIRPLRGSD